MPTLILEYLLLQTFQYKEHVFLKYINLYCNFYCSIEKGLHSNCVISHYSVFISELKKEACSIIWLFLVIGLYDSECQWEPGRELTLNIFQKYQTNTEAEQSLHIDLRLNYCLPFWPSNDSRKRANRGDRLYLLYVLKTYQSCLQGCACGEHSVRGTLLFKQHFCRFCGCGRGFWI